MNKQNQTELIKINIDNLEANEDSNQSQISKNGQYVTFVSQANNLVPNDNNNFPDIFIYDRQQKTIERASISTDGIEANSFSKEPVISSDGRYITFTSDADNLVSNDTNKSTDVFVYDRQNKNTERISINSNNKEAEWYSFAPAIDDDGRYVAFESNANNLVANDTNNATDIFIRDRDSKTTELISLDSNGTKGNKRSQSAAVSSDGKYVAFKSDADNLVSNDTNNDTDIFIRDRDSETTELISVTFDGTSANGYSFDPSVSGDGRYVVFESKASNLVGNDTNNKIDIFIRDRQTETTRRISLAADSTQANDNSINPVISHDGRYVVFESKATNLIPNDVNGLADVFVHDLLKGTIEPVNININGIQANNKSYGASISDRGEYITFSSDANNLAPKDSNDTTDIYIKESAGLLEQQDLTHFNTENVYRFYEFTRGNHFYTADEHEINIVRNKSEIGELGYKYEAAKFTVLSDDKDALTGETIAGVKPVYRFFNNSTGAHFYTMDTREKNFIQDSLDAYSFEGIQYYAFESQPEEIPTIPVMRMFNSESGSHLFTVDQNEINYIEANLPQFTLENNGNAAFYVFEL